MKTKNLLKKAFLLLALMGGASSAWADDVTLFTADFTNAKYNVTFPTSGTDSVSVDESGTTVWIKGYKNSAWGWSSTNGITFTGNNVNANAGAWTPTSPNYGIVIPLTGVNGTITVTTTGDATKWYYTYTNNAAQTTIVARQQAAANNGFTISGLENSNVTLFIGGSGKKIKSITITTPAPTKEISTQGLKSSGAVKVGETTLTLDAGTAGYSVSGTTITLSDDQQSAITPDNVKLVNHITYTDASTEDEDVDVSFDGKVTAGYFVGTATIDKTDYTVNMKKDLTPTAVLSATSGSIALTKSWKVGKVTFTLTGANLTNGTYDVTANVGGATIAPTNFTVADGEVSQEFTITSTDNTVATTVFTIGSVDMGVAAPTYTLTYSQSSPKRSVSQTPVSAATTWDWTNSGGESIQLLGSAEEGGPTSPQNGEEFLLAKLPEITNDATFKSEALKVVCQWPNRGTDYYWQGNSVKFTTTVPGTVQVWFSNTSNRSDTPANRRFLYVNGVNSEVYTLNQTFTNTSAMSVPAGEVVISAKTGEDTPAETMIRINKIVYTPITSVTITPSYDKSTYVTTAPLDFSNVVGGLKAYVATAAANGSVTLEEVGKVSTGTPLMLIGTAETEYTVPVDASASAPEVNMFRAGDGTTPFEGTTYDYILYNDGLFYQIGSGTVATNKAYLHCDSDPTTPHARELSISFGGVTGVENVEAAAKVKALPVKRIVNGKLVIENEGVIFNAFGQKVK